MIHSRLRQLRSPVACFGGINVLFFGNLMQIPPVRRHQVYQHLWRQVRLVELKQNMSQQLDTTFINVFSALRVGELMSKHLEVLFGKVSADTTEEFPTERTLGIYKKNYQVTTYIENGLQSFDDKGIVIYTIKV